VIVFNKETITISVVWYARSAAYLVKIYSYIYSATYSLLSSKRKCLVNKPVTNVGN